jgi:serine/threonine-protein kinase
MSPEPAMTSQPSSDLDELLRQTCAEMRRLLEVGLPCLVESFLESQPALAADRRRAQELIVTEVLTRQELGQHPDPGDWLGRFPAWAEELRNRFRAVGLLAPSSETCQDLPTASHAVTDASAAGGAAVELESLSRHELLGPIGQGGMGVVYRARDTVLGRLVALKMVRTEVLTGPHGVERFYREARAAAQVRHRHLMPILSVGLLDGQPCFTMPLVSGGSLSGRIDRLRHDLHGAVGDLKPGNILLDDEGEPLVADFGLAKFAGGVDVTRHGQLLGTPAYVSPEQAAGQNDRVGPASDVWSLGVILFEVLLGRRPFPAREAQEVLRQVMVDEPPRPSVLQPDLPRDLEAVVLRCLEKQPPDRYATAGALADDLARFLRGQPTSARPRSRLARTWRAVRWPVALLAAVVLLGVGVAVALWQPGKVAVAEPDRPAPHIFVGEDGLTPHRWAAGQGTLTPQPGKCVRLASKQVALLEVLPAVPWPRYRFEAEVQDDDPNTQEVGLYVGHREQKTAQGTEHWLCVLSFSERGILPSRLPGRPGRGQGALTALCYREPASRRLFPLLQTAPFAVHRPTWRKLALEVTPELLKAYWGGFDRPFGHVARATLVGDLRRGIAAHPPPLRPASAPALAFEGGLGLVCQSGAAVFRYVVIRPVPAEESGEE